MLGNPSAVEVAKATAFGWSGSALLASANHLPNVPNGSEKSLIIVNYPSCPVFAKVAAQTHIQASIHT